MNAKDIEVAASNFSDYRALRLFGVSSVLDARNLYANGHTESRRRGIVAVRGVRTKNPEVAS
jgi:hypothetical protein